MKGGKEGRKERGKKGEKKKKRKFRSVLILDDYDDDDDDDDSSTRCAQFLHTAARCQRSDAGRLFEPDLRRRRIPDAVREMEERPFLGSDSGGQSASR